MLETISDSRTWPLGAWSGCLKQAMLGWSSIACLVCSEHTGLCQSKVRWEIGELTCQDCCDFFVDDDIDLHASLSSG